MWKNCLETGHFVLHWMILYFQFPTRFSFLWIDISERNGEETRVQHSKLIMETLLLYITTTTNNNNTTTTNQHLLLLFKVIFNLFLMPLMYPVNSLHLKSSFCPLFFFSSPKFVNRNHYTITLHKQINQIDRQSWLHESWIILLFCVSTTHSKFTNENDNKTTP